MKSEDILCRAHGEKTALITETASYTYGELRTLVSMITKERAGSGKRGCRLIYEQTVEQQLLSFLASFDASEVPVIAVRDRKDELPCPEHVPGQADLGVMTSGSTGKAAVWWRTYDSWASCFPVQNGLFGLDGSTRLFLQGSLAFTGNLNMMLSVLFAGGTVVAADTLQPKEWTDMIGLHQVNAVYLIPSKLYLLARASAAALPAVSRIISGSQPMGRPQAEFVKKTFPSAEICLYYGASEAGYISYIWDKDMTDDTTLAGRPFPGVSVSVRGERGEIAVSSPWCVIGREDSCTVPDQGYMDEQGMVHLLGRSGDMVRIHGQYVSTYKIERLIEEAAFGAEAAVIAVKRRRAVILVAVLGGKHLSDDDMAHIRGVLKERLAPYERPRRYIVLPRLPKNESGKIDKRALTKMVLA